MYILKKLNREKNVSTEAEYKALLAEGWEDVTPSQADQLAKAISDAFSETEKPDENPSAEAGEGNPDEEPPAEEDEGKPDKKPRRGSQK